MILNVCNSLNKVHDLAMSWKEQLCFMTLSLPDLGAPFASPHKVIIFRAGSGHASTCIIFCERSESSDK